VKIVKSLGTNRTVGQAPSTSNDWLFWGCSRPPQFHVEKRSTFCFSFLLLFEISRQRKLVWLRDPGVGLNTVPVKTYSLAEIAGPLTGPPQSAKPRPEENVEARSNASIMNLDAFPCKDTGSRELKNIVWELVGGRTCKKEGASLWWKFYIDIIFFGHVWIFLSTLFVGGNF
jgi:hypothetical protein